MEESRELSDPIALLIRAEGAGRGSGFFVGKNLIATNIHVVAGATSISAELVGTETKFVVEGSTAFDPKNDLVILKIAGEGIPLPIGDSDLLQHGDAVQVIGYPRGKYKVTEGPIHSIRDSDKWIRMKCKTDGGNSGAPVLNGNGEVIAVAVANADYFTFAVPVTAVKMLLARMHEIEPLIQWQKREQIRAYVCLREGQNKHSPNLYPEAIVDLDKAIQLNPNCVYFYQSRGNVRFQLGKLKTDEGNLVEAQQHYRGTIDDYTKAIKLCPDYVSVYHSRGAAKSILGQFKFDEGKVKEAQNHYRDAIDDYTKGIELCANLAIVYNNRADTKWHFGKSEDAVGNIEAAKDLYQAALIDINTAIELDSDVALFYHTRGQIKAALGDYSAAIENYEAARKIDPDYTDVCEDIELARKALERVKRGPTED
ncbi:MAG: trypsin-like peptidase domain-containing protein [Candidatus Poribacteria bacterium]|nr:trypsin-like peptidase domain-containing protein [Candidatus Poribacteria bacterium]